MSESPKLDEKPQPGQPTSKKSHAVLIVIVCILVLGLAGAAAMVFIGGGVWLVSQQPGVQRSLNPPVGFGPYFIGMTFEEFEKIPAPESAGGVNGLRSMLERSNNPGGMRCYFARGDVRPFILMSPPDFIFVKPSGSDQASLVGIRGFIDWSDVDELVVALRKRYGTPTVDHPRDAYNKFHLEWESGSKRVLFKSQDSGYLPLLRFEDQEMYAVYAKEEAAWEERVQKEKDEREKLERQAAEEAAATKQKQKLEEETADTIRGLKSRLIEVRQWITAHDKIVADGKVQRRKLQAFRWKQQHPDSEYTDEQFERDEADDVEQRRLTQSETDRLSQKERELLSRLRELGVSETELSAGSDDNGATNP